MCEEYLINFHKDEIIKILYDDDCTQHFSININFIVLYEHQPDIVVELFKTPEKCLEQWNDATLKAQMVLLREAGENALLKNYVHCRIYHLPGLSEVRRTIFPGNNDAGKFLQVSGTVMRMSASKLLEYQRNYVCVKCKYSMLVKAEYDRKYIIKQPRKCENPEDCSGTNLIAFGDLDSDNCKDYQEVKIQEQVKKLGVGCMPNTMWVTLEDDLVDSCKPGDNVTICGIVKRRWGEFSKGSKIDIDIVLKANHVQVDNNSSSAAAATPEIKQMFSTFWEKYSGNPLAGRDLILKSFCPQIYGLYLVKLAIAVVLAGGSRIEDTTFTGVRTRSESHLLLVGDPGTGKSQLLRFASKIIPRSVLTTGVGSTAAGLTVTAMMEHGEWQLEGGALVMSDGGICCIDEFNSMKEHDRTSIHEAMEQQTISVAKASIVCKLNTRCSVLAACNPKGNLDVTQPLCMSIALPSPLLSRFDLILLLRDTVNEDWDTQVIDYILNCGNKISKLTDSTLWSVDMLQSYFTIIRKLNPKLSENAEKILGSYYQMQRRIDSRNKSRTTVRLLESLVRLSQGHARLMYHEMVETVDSIYAIVLVDAAMENESSILDLNISSYSVFPQYPSCDYRSMMEAVLHKLGLHQILTNEIAILAKIKESELAANVRSRFFNMRYMSHEDNGQGTSADVENPHRSDSADGGEKESIENHDEISDINLVVNLKDKSKKRSINPNNEDKQRKRIKRIVDAVNNADNPNEIIDVIPSSSNVSQNITINKHNKLTILDINDEKVSKSGKKLCDNSGNKKVESKNSKEATKKIKKPFNITDDVFDLDFDEGYDTLSFGAEIRKNKVNKRSSKKDVSVNTSKTANSSTFGTNVTPQTSEGTSACPISPNNNSINGRSSTTEVEKENRPVDKEMLPKRVGDKVKQSCIKDKLKRFKFVLKDKPDDDKKVMDVECNSEGSKKSGAVKEIKCQKEKNSDDIENQKSCNNFVKEDLEMLRLFPSYNDDFNIDLDFDWDNVNSEVDNKLKTKAKKKKQIVKKVSDVSATTSSMSRSSSIISSQSSKVNIFHTSDENVDDLDLDI